MYDTAVITYNHETIVATIISVMFELFCFLHKCVR